MRLRHLAAGVLSAALACVLSWPLPRHLFTHLPGGGIGDNVQFLWNFWWMRTALAAGADFFETAYLFAPIGTDITLHTHTALPAFIGATALAGLPVLAAHNVMVLAALALNGFCAYLLTWRVTRAWGPALLGGLIFAASPYIAAHLNGHFNLVAAWTIPLFAFALLAPGSWLVPGLVLGVTAYIDYYDVIYQLAFLFVAWAWASHLWELTARRATHSSRRLAIVFGVLAAVVLLLAVAIGVTGGFVLDRGLLRVSARSAFNPLQAFWILAGASLVCVARPSLIVTRTPSRGPLTRTALLTLAAAGLVALPVLWHGAAIVLRGEYVTQQYFWRSAPKGIDLATLLLANPFHGVWGGAVRAVYARLGIDAVEQVAWLGIVPLLLAGHAIRAHWADAVVRTWTAVGAFFFVWALGPHLMVFGANTGMILPQTILRYVPIASNARVPGRAIVVTALAVAVLAAIAASRWKTSRRALGLAVAGVLVLADFLPAPFPIAVVDRPAIYETLRDRPEPGIVLELPAGTRDSFQTQGSLDHRVLAYQAIHGRPIVGGVVSRLSPRVIASYADDPLLGPLLRLSAGGSGIENLPDRTAAIASLGRLGIDFVMLNRETAPAALVRYVEDVLALPLVAEDGPRSLYVPD